MMTTISRLPASTTIPPRRCQSAAPTRILRLLIIALTLTAPSRAATLPETAQSLFSSFTADQKAQALLPYDNPERTNQQYTGGRRPGIQIKDLNPDQQKLAIDLLTQFLSPYGKQKAQEIADQPSG